MKKLRYGVAALLAMTAGAAATPLRLEYCVVDLGGGSYEYTFKLILDNNDGTWVAGQAWRWFIYGDEPGVAQGGTGVSPLTAWAGNPSSLPIGPWTSYTSSGGSHNGPTLGPVLNYWTPAAIGETLTWKGTSTADLAQGALKFSTLAGTLNGGVAPNFEIAHRVSCGGTATCYANCDASTNPPCLNVNDFVCFNNLYSAGSSLANCDGSTNPPTLNVNDFVCFNNLYSAGCANPCGTP